MRGTKEQMAPQIREYLEQVNQQTREAGLSSTTCGQARGRLPARAAARRSRGHRAVARARDSARHDRRVRRLPVSLLREDPAVDDDRCSRDLRRQGAFRLSALPAVHPQRTRSVAAEASMCAHEQGKFWEMHDGMFANMRALEADQLKATAAGLGLDAAAVQRLPRLAPLRGPGAGRRCRGQCRGCGRDARSVRERPHAQRCRAVEDITKIVDDELRRRGSKRQELITFQVTWPNAEAPRRRAPLSLPAFNVAAIRR